MVAGDLAPAFQNLYPEILDPLISEEEFRALIKHVNDELIKAFDPLSWTSVLDAVLGVATFWVWEDILMMVEMFEAIREWKLIGSQEGKLGAWFGRQEFWEAQFLSTSPICEVCQRLHACLPALEAVDSVAAEFRFWLTITGGAVSAAQCGVRYWAYVNVSFSDAGSPPIREHLHDKGSIDVTRVCQADASACGVSRKAWGSLKVL